MLNELKGKLKQVLSFKKTKHKTAESSYPEKIQAVLDAYLAGSLPGAIEQVRKSNFSVEDGQDLLRIAEQSDHNQLANHLRSCGADYIKGWRPYPKARIGSPEEPTKTYTPKSYNGNNQSGQIIRQ
jgi:hypothetical protein